MERFIYSVGGGGATAAGNSEDSSDGANSSDGGDSNSTVVIVVATLAGAAALFLMAVVGEWNSGRMGLDCFHCDAFIQLVCTARTKSCILKYRPL